MTKIEEGNRVLAEFEGNTNDRVFYHDSYDWLMPVWVKFRELRFDDSKQRARFAKRRQDIRYAMTEGTVPELFAALVEAVRWWNEVKKK
jgi:hypothetical protein